MDRWKLYEKFYPMGHSKSTPYSQTSTFHVIDFSSENKLISSKNGKLNLILRYQPSVQHTLQFNTKLQCNGAFVLNWRFFALNWRFFVLNWRFSVLNWRFSVFNWRFFVLNWRFLWNRDGFLISRDFLLDKSVLFNPKFCLTFFAP